MQSGLNPVKADRRDYDFLKTFGAVLPTSLPASFSIYDGQEIPNQNDFDHRFTPPIPPLPMGCTGETAAFESGIQDGVLYNPEWIYRNTPPGGNGGRGMREMLSFLVKNGPAEGEADPKRKGYFNVYGSSNITDYDAVKIALWLNQEEKRGVYVGSYFYPAFVGKQGVVDVPSFNVKEGSLHCWLIMGWKTINGKEYLEAATWQGNYIQYFSKEVYNALMGQPYTGAFTISKYEKPPLPVGLQAIIDQLVYYVRSLFNISPYTPPNTPPNTPQAPTEPIPAPRQETAPERLAEVAKAMLGKDASPLNRAPQELSCAEGVVNVINSVWPDTIDSSIVGTDALYQALKKSPRFKAVLDPIPGCVVVSPKTATVHGHTGVYTEPDTIASNDSGTGLWTENYTRASWRSTFIQGRGLKGYLFEPVDVA